NVFGLLRSLINGDWYRVKERGAVLLGNSRDPYDAYEWLDSVHLYCRVKAYYFFLVASRQTGVDKNIPICKPALQELIRYHAHGSRVGVHPSWQSGDDEVLLKEEIEWMECMTEQKVTRSRQHYIRFTLPETYRRLIKYGILQDFSMGYGSINGFRASVASSFYWYDLEKEETTSLRIFPFCFMDANAFYEQHYTADQARNELMRYYHLIRKVNGLMVTIWHNSFLGTDTLFAGWREVYETFLRDEIYWDA
ncbi:polysaccharide deacetylase family protein, partial [Flavitalea flava]